MATAALQNVCFKATVSRPSVSQTRARSVVVCAVRPQDVAAHVAAAATAATLLVASPVLAAPVQQAQPVATLAEQPFFNLEEDKNSGKNSYGTPLSDSRYTGTLSGDEQSVRSARESLAKAAQNDEFAGTSTTTNTLLDPYGLPKSSKFSPTDKISGNTRE